MQRDGTVLGVVFIAGLLLGSLLTGGLFGAYFLFGTAHAEREALMRAREAEMRARDQAVMMERLAQERAEAEKQARDQAEKRLHDLEEAAKQKP
jgi:hypothetical protein